VFLIALSDERQQSQYGLTMRILITGGAGFVGGALARYFQRSAEGNTVVVLDNLRRRGSDWNLQGLIAEGVTFVHGDVRNPADLEALDGTFDVMIEASAEASVHAGVASSPRYVLDTNLIGAMNCLEFAHNRCGGFVFLSSSRIYSIEPLTQLPLTTMPTRLDIQGQNCCVAGLSSRGIAEDFSCNSHRSYYGATKLAAELLCQEYAAEAGLPVVINRCGVIAGPGQFGKTDQGVFTLWVARHHFGRPLKYTGFGGKGLQVRDLLHSDDLCDLIARQLNSWRQVSGETFNIGGGRAGAVSLQEYTALCEETVGRTVTIAEDATTSPVDIPWYISDHSKITDLLGWTPKKQPKKIVEDIAEWVCANESILSAVIV
jgi:CDP-paratose 2-epimerase